MCHLADKKRMPQLLNTYPLFKHLLPPDFTLKILRSDGYAQF